MATYEYRCNRDGVFEITRPLGTAPNSCICCVCGSEAGRTFSVAMLRLGSRPAVFAASDYAEKSRYEPDVVNSVPAAGARWAHRCYRLRPRLTASRGHDGHVGVRPCARGLAEFGCRSHSRGFGPETGARN